LRLNIIGLIAAIFAFFTMFLPWYSISGFITIYGGSLLDLVSGRTSLPGSGTTQPWFIWVTFILIIVGGLLGVVGSFSIGKNGRILLLFGGLLVDLSGIIFVVGRLSSKTYIAGAFGDICAILAGGLMNISTRKHPMEDEKGENEEVPSAPIIPPPTSQ